MRADVWPRHTWESDAQQDERRHLQDVSQHRAEYRHVEKDRSHWAALWGQVNGERDRETERGAREQSAVGRLARAVSDR